MDLNKQIIFAVRKRPCLNNSRNINERNLAWKQLAEELKIDGETQLGNFATSYWYLNLSVLYSILILFSKPLGLRTT